MAIQSRDGLAREVSVTTTSARTAIPSASEFYKIILNNNSSVNIHYRLGDVTVVAVAFSSGAGDPFIPPNSSMELWIKGATHLALVVGTGTATAEFFPYSELF